MNIRVNPKRPSARQRTASWRNWASAAWKVSWPHIFQVESAGGLEIARALIQDPKFILLDEPFAGIDPLAVDDIQGIIQNLRSKGIGVLISDHNVRETLQICDRAYLVYDGRIILSGSPTQIVADPKARKVYLGEGFSL